MMILEIAILIAFWGIATMGTMFVLVATKTQGFVKGVLRAMIVWVFIFFMLITMYASILEAAMGS